MSSSTSTALPGRRRLWREFVGKCRRAWLAWFRPGYVREQIALRRGACRQCGRCCRLLHRCLFLRADNRCKVYHLKRPANCVIFPVDERDLREVDFQCGFYFESAGNADGAK